MAVTLGLTRLLASGRLTGARVGLVANPSSVERAAGPRRRTGDRRRGRHAGGDLRPAARLPLDAAGQHDRDAARRGRGTARARLLAVQRDPRAHRRDARRPRRAGRRPAGRGHARLYVHLHDGVLPEGGGAARHPGGRLRPAEPDRRPDRRGTDAGRRVTSRSSACTRSHFDTGSRSRNWRVSSTRQFGIGAQLETVTMEGWSRGDWWDATGLPWVMPSPNMPTPDTATVYPGMVLFEGTLISEGRGTTRPFELVGHPGIDADAFARGLNALQLPGVHFRPAYFEPTFQKHARVTCGGCQLHVTDRERSGRSMRPSHCCARSGTHSPASRCRGGHRRTSTSTRRCRSTSWRVRTACVVPWTRARIPRKSA